MPVEVGNVIERPDMNGRYSFSCTWPEGATEFTFWIQTDDPGGVDLGRTSRRDANGNAEVLNLEISSEHIGKKVFARAHTVIEGVEISSMASPNYAVIAPRLEAPVMQVSGVIRGEGETDPPIVLSSAS